jgi:hypothetical protein
MNLNIIIIKTKIFIIFIFPLLLIEIYRYYKLKQIKICICTIGKEENRYIIEYIEYYKNYGIDKIFLYDNNNLNGEYFDNILEKYKNEDFIEIKNWRGIKSPQMKIYKDCYINNYEKYEWLIFNDIDEYLYLKSYNNIKDFLNKRKFKNCENIQLNWLLYTDNNLIHYQNKPLKIRFKEKDPYLKTRKISKFSNGKSILKGHIPNIKITNFHCISKDLKTCDGFGIERKFLMPNYKYYYFKHYFCKSTEEFIDKLKKGDVYIMTNMFKINFYFSYNKITNEKLNYIEKQTGENLTDFKYKLNLSKKII